MSIHPAPFPGLENATHEPRDCQGHDRAAFASSISAVIQQPRRVPQYAPVAQTAAELSGATVYTLSLPERAAREVRAADAVVMIRKVMGLPDSDTAGFYMPMDDGRKWKRAGTTDRLMWIGDWLRAETYVLADELTRPVARPDHMNGPSE